MRRQSECPRHDLHYPLQVGSWKDAVAQAAASPEALIQLRSSLAAASPDVGDTLDVLFHSEGLGGLLLQYSASPGAGQVRLSWGTGAVVESACGIVESVGLEGGKGLPSLR